MLIRQSVCFTTIIKICIIVIIIVFLKVCSNNLELTAAILLAHISPAFFSAHAHLAGTAPLHFPSFSLCSHK